MLPCACEHSYWVWPSVDNCMVMVLWYGTHVHTGRPDQASTNVLSYSAAKDHITCKIPAEHNCWCAITSQIAIYNNGVCPITASLWNTGTLAICDLI